MTKKIIIYGKTGQVGSALSEILKDKAVSFASTEYDFSDLRNIRQALGNIDSATIINATAYTDVNKAETDEEAAYKANALIPEAMALYAREKGIPFIHYSTDYVFPGEGDHPHKETERTAPLNAYGRSKLAGEQKVAAVGGKYLIFRTSWVYDHKGKNFLNTMLKLGKERESLSIVADQFGAPTYAAHLAGATVDILSGIGNGAFPSGIYHLCNSGCASWHDFALEIFNVAREKGLELKVSEVKPISASDFPTPAKRPANSRMDTSLVYETFGVRMPDWRDGVRECLGRM